MVSIALIWIYMALVSFVMGFVLLNGIFRKNKDTVYRLDSYLMAGIAVLTVYAQFFSIFYKVGLLANVILILLCGLFAVLFRKEMYERLKLIKGKATVIKILLVVFVVLAFAYGSSTGYIHYDTSLYHAQSIRWIEEYGVVKGLGNLHMRLAYNSAAFSITALFSMAFLGGQSFHCVAGFLALIVFGTCIGDVGKKKEKGFQISDLAKVIALYYLLNIYDEMISPASDYFVTLMLFYIVIKWLMLLERKETSYLPYAFLCLLGVSAITMKLSTALILLLTIKPACMMIREKRVKEIGAFLGLGIFTVLPFLIRNVLLSGWLVYPYSKLDFFSVDWKMPKEAVDYDYMEIQVWGRGYKNVAEYDMPITKWFPDWFLSQSIAYKVLVLGAVSTVFIIAACLIFMLIRRKWKMADWLLVSVTLCLSFFFWLTSAPLIRYGFAYVWLTPVVVYGYLYFKIVPKKPGNYLILAGMVLFFGYKVFAFGRECISSFAPRYLICQKDYENHETASYQLNGYTFYYPTGGDRTGYRDFPSAPNQVDIQFRGEGLKDGFRRWEAIVPLIPENDVLFEKDHGMLDFDSAAALAIEPVYEQEGVFGGSPVIWSTINTGDFLYFFYRFTSLEVLAPEYASEIIIGEDIELSCKIHVGMTSLEAENIIPGLYHFRWENPEYRSFLDWNPNTYPKNWCQQFPEILIAEIENGNEMPLTLGLFLDGEDVIRAIGFNYPTAG